MSHIHVERREDAGELADALAGAKRIALDCRPPASTDTPIAYASFRSRSMAPHGPSTHSRLISRNCFRKHSKVQIFRL
jgi:hypothetical protein